jgi:glutathione S-transferase
VNSGSSILLPESVALPVLYTFRRCPYAIRARMALRYAGIAVEQREVALRDKPAALLAISPKATVPVLQLGDGTVMQESLDIMAWALERADPEGWLDAGDADQAMQWIQLNDEAFKPLLDRYKYADRYPELSRSEHRERALKGFVDPLDCKLREDDYLLGARISWADVAIFPFVRQFAMVDKDWFDTAPLHGIQAWLAGWLSSALFASVMVKPPSAAQHEQPG